MNKTAILIKRLSKLGIDIEIVFNCPFTYITKINNKYVTEIYMADHGYNICWMPLKMYGEECFTDISKIFKLIRSYL